MKHPGDSVDSVLTQLFPFHRKSKKINVETNINIENPQEIEILKKILDRI